MNTLEDRVRSATRAAADTVPPDSVPPLWLPPANPAGGSRRPSWFGSPWARRLAPLTAALAVVTVAVAMVLVGRAAQEPASGPGNGITPPGPVTAGPPVSSYVASGQVPRYYVTIESRGNPNFTPSYAVVRATVTGAALGTIQASAAHGTVVAVTAAVDDRTFVLDEQPFVATDLLTNQAFEPRTFYLVRLGPSGQPGRPARLPMTVPGGQMMTGFALSPDGSKLAIAVEPDNVKNRPNLQQIRVYTLATGAVQTWSADGTIGFGPDDARSLSWASDERTLAFSWTAASAGVQTSVRLLDTETGGGNLLADSRQAVSLVNQPLPFLVPTTVMSPTAAPYGSSPASASGLASSPEPTTVSSSASAPAATSVGPTPVPTTTVPYITPSGGAAPSLACEEDSVITPDGSLIVCGAMETLRTTDNTSHGQFSQNTSHGQFSLLSDVETGFVEYSTATGKVTHILGHWTIDNETSNSVDVLWSDSSGRVIIGVIPSANGNGRVGVINGNEFTPLPAQAASVSPDSGTW
jgi:hypothetical protein